MSESNNGLNTALIVAVAVVSSLLVCGCIGFGLYRRKVNDTLRHHRLEAQAIVPNPARTPSFIPRY